MNSVTDYADWKKRNKKYTESKSKWLEDGMEIKADRVTVCLSGSEVKKALIKYIVEKYNTGIVQDKTAQSVTIYEDYTADIVFEKKTEENG